MTALALASTEQAFRILCSCSDLRRHCRHVDCCRHFSCACAAPSPVWPQPRQPRPRGAARALLPRPPKRRGRRVRPATRPGPLHRRRGQAPMRPTHPVRPMGMWKRRARPVIGGVAPVRACQRRSHMRMMTRSLLLQPPASLTCRLRAVHLLPRSDTYTAIPRSPWTPPLPSVSPLQHSHRKSTRPQE